MIELKRVNHSKSIAILLKKMKIKTVDVRNAVELLVIHNFFCVYRTQCDSFFLSRPKT